MKKVTIKKKKAVTIKKKPLTVEEKLEQELKDIQVQKKPKISASVHKAVKARVRTYSRKQDISMSKYTELALLEKIQKDNRRYSTDK